MSQCLGIGEVIDRHEFQVFPVQTCPKDMPTDSTKSVNSNPDCHIVSSLL